MATATKKRPLQKPVFTALSKQAMREIFEIIFTNQVLDVALDISLDYIRSKVTMSEDSLDNAILGLKACGYLTSREQNGKVFLEPTRHGMRNFTHFISGL